SPTMCLKLGRYMKSIDVAQTLYAVGRYREVVESMGLDSINTTIDGLLLHAEVVIRTGEPDAAVAIISRVDRARGMTDGQRSRREYVGALISQELGNFDAELNHLQKSISFAERAPDLERLCLAQLHLLIRLADRSGIETASALM